MDLFGMDIESMSSVFEKDSKTNQLGPDKEKLKEKVNFSVSAEKSIAPVISESRLAISRKRKLIETTSFSKIKDRDFLADSAFNPTHVSVHRVNTVGGCLHEVAVPKTVQYTGLTIPTGPPAKQYPFQLDPFQKESVLCIENNQTVLVSAHTSAGKTVVAEYAIATCLRNKQRVIYTTPIKALSNQKFREFTEEFKEVGLLTGDVTINPSASVLIMTTEILRSMLYKGSDVLREVGWVVFDEIHYMRDKSRGVVWEETIILLPSKVRSVYLSATIPNAPQFAQWVAALHSQPCHVVYTDYRPVPLQHYIFPCGGDGIHLVVDENGDFKSDNFEAAMHVLQSSGDNAKSDMQQRGRKGGFQKGTETGCYKIIKVVMERNLEPLIVFSFSKKQCESYAMQLRKLDFNSDTEKASIELIFNNAISTLSLEDQKLPSIESLLPILKKGIGIHHGGLLPLLKETVEILFGEGLIKCLFATETFAMGLNMPARTVLFTAARKFDGKDFRFISSGEYIQMSGRAGRRGKDDRGTVILMLDEKMSPTVSKEIIQGKSDPLNSAFHLTYNMVVNLLRVEEINPEFLMERSFFQFQNYAALPDLWKKLDELEGQLNTQHVEDQEGAKSYQRIRLMLDNMLEEQWTIATKPKYILSFLQPGRLIKVLSGGGVKFDWSVCLGLKKGNKKQVNNSSISEDRHYTVRCLVQASRASVELGHDNLLVPGDPMDEEVDWVVLDVPLTSLRQVSAVCIKMPASLEQKAARQGTGDAIDKVKDKLKEDIPLLDPVTDLKIKDDSFIKLKEGITLFEDRLQNHKLHSDPNRKDIMSQFEQIQAICFEMEDVRLQIAKHQSLLQMDELKARKRILRRMQFCTENDVITLKGRVACEISSADELLLTELLLEGVFNNLSPGESAALLSCFVFDEKMTPESISECMTEELNQLYKTLQDKARYIARVSRESRLELDEDDYVDSFSPALMPVVDAWTNGSSFGRVCQMTAVFEGSIVRCMRRLEELLRQMHAAAKSIGNTALESRFAQAMVLIKRDIIFAASLYL